MSAYNKNKQQRTTTTRGARISRFVARARETTVQKVQIQVRTMFETTTNGLLNIIAPPDSGAAAPPAAAAADHSKDKKQPTDDPYSYPDDRLNYALLILLYTLQGIPMGLSASIPFLLQEKITKMTAAAAAVAGVSSSSSSTAATAVIAARASYNANAIFALCSWPFSLKLLWAPIVDSVYLKRFGRRKSWLVPVQTLAGLIMVGGADFVEDQLGLSSTTAAAGASMNVQGVTTFFFILYFLMATQDIAVDGWALTMLSKPNRGKGPICNSIGQNIGYFLSFVGFLALNDAESSETLWRPLLRLPSNPTKGLVSLKGFLRFMGVCMLLTTAIVAIFKRELPPRIAPSTSTTTTIAMANSTEPATPPFLARFAESDDDDEEAELDASEIGLRETYHRLWAVCQLPAVRWLFLILVTYRLPTALSDNVKFLKAVEYGLSKSTTALLSPTLILPLGILVPIAAHKIWHMAPLQQFLTAYQFRVTLVPLLDLWMLHQLRTNPHHHSHSTSFWLAIIGSTAAQAICNSLQFNAQMIFFASRVDPAIGGSYMTLLNTAANLGGTWPSSFVMWLLSSMTMGSSASSGDGTASAAMTPPRDPYVKLQIIFASLGILWLVCLSPRLKRLAALPDDAWRTHLLDSSDTEAEDAGSNVTDLESGDADLSKWKNQIADDEKNK
jgi:PAT family acetyl-CoA transporter-like MFS transporter 1